MDGALIVGAAIGVGVVVYVLSLRAPDRSLKGRLGFGREPAPLDAVPEPESSLYVPVLPATELDWRTRIGGVVGLLLVVIAAALLVALGINQLGHSLNQTIQGFLDQ